MSCGQKPTIIQGNKSSNIHLHMGTSTFKKRKMSEAKIISISSSHGHTAQVPAKFYRKEIKLRVKGAGIELS